MGEGSGKTRSHLTTVEKTEFLEVQTLRLDRRRFTKSLYHQLPIEDLFDVPGGWLGRPFVQVLACPRECPGLANHLHVVWQKPRTARLAIINEERDGRYADIKAIESAEKMLAESVRFYISAGLLTNQHVLTLEGTLYLVRGPWHRDYVLGGFHRLELPAEVDEWLGGEDPMFGRGCRLVASEMAKAATFLPHNLKRTLAEEFSDWRSPREAFEVATRRVTHELIGVQERAAELEAKDDAWHQTYTFLESLEEVFL